jgi:hypothetical protein
MIIVLERLLSSEASRTATSATTTTTKTTGTTKNDENDENDENDDVAWIQRAWHLRDDLQYNSVAIVYYA